MLDVLLQAALLSLRDLIEDLHEVRSDKLPKGLSQY